MQLIPTAHSLASIPPRRVSLVTLCRRAHGLGIETHEVLACPTVAALHALARQRYYAQARQYHPDAQARRKEGGMRCDLHGRRFAELANTYAWLLAVDPAQVIDSTLGLTPPEVPLPIEWSRAPVALGVPPRWPRRVGSRWQGSRGVPSLSHP